MYKKITHDIVEEHYAHPPAVLDAVRARLGPDAMLPGAAGPGVLPPLPAFVINERTLIFRMDSRTLWTRYALGMVNFSVSEFGSLASTAKVEANLGRNASAVGNYFVPYYGITAGTKISSLLTAVCKNGTKVVAAVKNGSRDLDVYREIWARESISLAEYFNKLNPNQYPEDLIAEMAMSLTNFWIDDFIARIENDFAADQIALDNILKVAVIGIPNHANKGYSSLADILSRGIISQFPLSFAD
jgi:hypothetical protein